jgi:PAS domain S-box-containing protein
MAKIVKKPPAAFEDIKFNVKQLSLLRLGADSLPVLISYVDSGRRYRFNNKAYKLWFGLDPTELYGKHVREILGDSYPKINKYIRIALSGRKVSYEDSVAYKDGRKRYINADYIPDIAENGRVRGFFALVYDISERRKVEDDLRMNEDQFRFLVENASDIIAVLTHEGIVTYVSPQVRKILGYTPDCLAGRKIHDIFHPDDRERLSESIEEIIRNPGTTVTNEGRALHRNGTWRTIEGSGKTVFDKFGEAGIVILARDITEKKRIEKEKRIISRRLVALWEIARMTESGYRAMGKRIIDEIVKLADSPYGFIGALNEDESIMTAYSFSENTENECRVELKTDRYFIENSGIWADAVRRRKTVIVNDYSGEYSGKKGFPKGHVPVKRFMAVPIIVGGKIVALTVVANKSDPYSGKDAVRIKTFVTSAHTIFEKKKADDALKKAEERYRGIFENAMEGIFQSLPGGGYLTVNPAMVRIFGYDSPEEMIKGVADIKNQIYADPERHDELKRHFKTRDVLKGFEYQAVRKDGSVIWVSMNLRAVRDEKGNILYYEGNVGDITEKKILQAERMQTDRLAILGELAAGVAHEINNPINGIINYAQMIIDRAGGKNTELPERIVKESDRIAGIVNLLLGFAGDRKDGKASVRIRTIVNDTLALIREQIRNENIRIDIRIPSGLPEINVYSRQIQQVLLNLLSNSRHALNRKYRGADKNKIIRIGAKTVKGKAAGKVLITVYDNGEGIRRSLLKRVCDPFFTTKPVGEGTGLGLNVSRRIIEEHGGKLTFESEEGEYTKAVIELPVAS